MQTNDGRTDGRTPDRCVSLSAMDVGNIKILCGTVGLSQVPGRQLATSRSCCRRTSGLTNAAVSQSTCFTYLLTAGVGESETGK